MLRIITLRPVMSETRDAGLRDVPVLLFVRGFLLLSVAMTLVVGLHWYLGARLISDALVPQPFASAAWALLWTFFAALFAGFIGGRLLPRSLAKVAQWFGFVWMGAFGLGWRGADIAPYGDGDAAGRIVQRLRAGLGA